MPQSWDMGQIILLPLRRKACWGFFQIGKIPTASVGFEPANSGEQRCSSTISLTLALDGVGEERHTPAALPPGKKPGSHCTGGWVGTRASLERVTENLAPTGIQSPDLPGRSESLYRLRYAGSFFGKSKQYQISRKSVRRKPLCYMLTDRHTWRMHVTGPFHCLCEGPKSPQRFFFCLNSQIKWTITQKRDNRGSSCSSVNIVTKIYIGCQNVCLLQSIKTSHQAYPLTREPFLRSQRGQSVELIMHSISTTRFSPPPRTFMACIWTKLTIYIQCLGKEQS
jgi:hypothetical protein